jgi:radical SAM superfamily enzyme YgiQ (UPF0313 family)
MKRKPIAEGQKLLSLERGTIRKDWGGKLPIALAFPNSYYVGMSSLAVHALYRLWNARDDVACERVFARQPTGLGTSGGKHRTKSDEPVPHSLESGAPLDFFPVIAFTVSYELDYFGLVSLLRAGDIPPRALDRDERHPLIIAGGPAVSANPEPLAPLLDAVVIGEVEPIFDRLTDALHLAGDRSQVLSALAVLPGVYVPALKPPEERATDHLSPSFSVARQRLRNLDSFPTYSAIITPRTEFADTGLIEIARGCGHGCHFCLAGYVYSPPRQRSLEGILETARNLLRLGKRIGLVSAAVSDYAHIDQLAHELRALGARISVSSLRADSISEPLVQALAQSGTRTLTIAPEAGSERLRKVINKTQTDEEVFRAVELARRYGLKQLKLYFMVGLPTESADDIEALAHLAIACAERFRHQVTVNITPFVPKAHTPFQRMEQVPAQTAQGLIADLERKLKPKGIQLRAESPAWAEIQGTLARGDARLAEALLQVDKIGPSAWRMVLESVGLSSTELLGARSVDEPLPWSFIVRDTPSTPPADPACLDAIRKAGSA